MIDHPLALDAERAVLGSILLQPEVLDEIDLAAGEFTDRRHVGLYGWLRCRWAAGLAIDLVSVPVALGLERPPWYDAVYTFGLADDVPSAAAWPTWAAQVREAAQRRALLAGAETLIRRIREGVPLEDLRGVVEALGAALDSGTTSAWETLGARVDEVIADVEARCEARAATGHRTGLRELDSILGGLCPGRLYLVGARPAMGKSAIAQQIAEEVASMGLVVGIWSQEMPARELIERSLVRRSGLLGRQVRDGRLDSGEWGRLLDAAADVRGVRVFVDDRSGRRIGDIVGAARQLARQARVDGMGLGLLVVDYLQLMSLERGRGDSQALALAETTRQLKGLARELEVPVMALSQLNRQCEGRADKRPQMSDLRDSGGLEQDADCVVLLYRDVVYHPECEDRDLAEVIVAKQRHGPTGTARVPFRAEVMRWGG